MLDEGEQQYILNRLSKQPQLLSNIPDTEEQKTKSRKRVKVDKERPMKLKRVMPSSDSGAETDEESGSELEEKYEQELAERPAKRMKSLLPIKTKEGITERTEECEDSETESEKHDEIKPEAPSKEDHDESSSDSGLLGTPEECDTPDREPADDNVISAVDLMVARKEKLNNDKLRIGALCSSLLESPEKKLKNFFPILYLMEERLKDGSLNLHSVRKLATLSAYEVFKDILPEYQIRHQDYSNVKLKKDTLALYKYEKELLEMYKRYLQRLEKAAAVLRRKKGDTRKPEAWSRELGVLSVRCLCGMLDARPGFNYSSNIAQTLVPFLDCADPQARGLVTDCCANVFAHDNKGEITLVIVRLINQLVKRRGERLHPSALDCLLSLKIKDVDIDAEADIKFKKKQDEKHKKRIVNLSKKEKKRAKKLKEVEKELLETQAQEDEAARKRQLTEVVKTVFHIYFRLLKSAPSSKLLVAALDGISKFGHVINLELYSDLVRVLCALLGAESPRGAGLRAARCGLGVLAAAGDALALDPARFHAYLYANMLYAHAGGTQDSAPVVLGAAAQVCGRARLVPGAVLQALGKRLGTLALQLPPAGALAALALLHRLATQSKAVSALLVREDEPGGAGRFDPLLPSPEHCHADTTHLYELAALRRHHHPAVRRAAARLPRGDLPDDLAKMSTDQILEAYDCSQMAFKPAVPPPGHVQTPRKRTSGHAWTQPSLKEYCLNIEKNIEMSIKL